MENEWMEEWIDRRMGCVVNIFKMIDCVSTNCVYYLLFVEACKHTWMKF